MNGQLFSHIFFSFAAALRSFIPFCVESINKIIVKMGNALLIDNYLFLLQMKNYRSAYTFITLHSTFSDCGVCMRKCQPIDEVSGDSLKGFRETARPIRR